MAARAWRCACLAGLAVAAGCSHADEVAAPPPAPTAITEATTPASATDDFLSQNGPYCDDLISTWADSPVRVARVRASAGDRVHFQLPDRTCPGGPECRVASYVVPGDTVFVSHEERGFSCAWYTDAQFRSTVYYLPTDALEFAATAAPALADWVGLWIDSEEPDTSALAADATASHAELDLREVDGAIEVAGTAFWFGPVIDEQGNRSVHDGELAGRFVPEGGLGTIAPADEHSCGAALQRVGDALLVADNGRCGGAGVGFHGRFRRKEPSP